MMASKSKITKAKKTAVSKPSVKNPGRVTKRVSAPPASKKAERKIPLAAAKKPDVKKSKETPKAKPSALRGSGQKKALVSKTATAKNTPKTEIPSWRESFSPSSQAALPARAQLAVDRSEISDVIYAAARALDRLDEPLLRSVFHADATVDLGPGLFQGASADFIFWILGALNDVKSSHHLVGNVFAQVEGDAASVESYVQTHFRLDKPTGREDLFIGSRLLDRFERRPSGPSGVWKIVHRKEILDWVRNEAVSDFFYHQNPDALWSSRTKEDPSYLISKFPGSQSGTRLPSFLGRRADTKTIKF